MNHPPKSVIELPGKMERELTCAVCQRIYLWHGNELQWKLIERDNPKKVGFCKDCFAEIEKSEKA